MRRFKSYIQSIITLFLSAGMSLLATAARADIILTTSNGYGPAAVGSYTTSGQPINPNFITGLNSTWGIAVSGSNVFVANGSTVGEYTISGATVNASLVTNAGTIRGIAVAGSTLYVTNQNGGVGQYTIANGTVTASNPSFITGAGLSPTGIAVSGSTIFVCNFFNGVITEYTTAGAFLNAFGAASPTFVAVSGSNLFVTDYSNGTVNEYTTSGALVKSGLITGLSAPESIFLSGSDLYIANSGYPDSGVGTIGEYDTSGNTINAALITGLNDPEGVTIAAVPEPSSLILLGLTIGVVAFGAWVRRRRFAAAAL